MLSKHATVRARQRGYRLADVELVSCLGTEVADGFLLTRRDIDRMAPLTDPLLAERLVRLVGSFVPSAAGLSLSIYRPSRRRMRLLLTGRRPRHRHDSRRIR